MSVRAIQSFSEQAKATPALAQKLKDCLKVKELIALAKEEGFEFEEDSLYPPNEPQFVAEQLSERMAKALLRA